MSFYLPYETTRRRYVWIALCLLAALSVCAAGQANSASGGHKATVAKGEVD